MDNYVALRIKALDGAKPDLDELKLKLDELKGRVAEARAEVSTAEADRQLTDLEAKLEAVSKKVASPKIDVAGASRANAQITAVEADLDGLDAKAAESAAAQESAAAKSEASGSRWAGMGEKVKMALLGVGVGAAAAVYEAGKYQDSTTHLVTDAGESAKALGMVQQGMLAVAAATGTSSADIVNGMYHVESAGYHGALGLKVLKVAAEGAKVGGADLDTMSKSLTGTMNAYYGSTTTAANATQRSTSMMNALIATVGAGDMRMQDLASSLGNVAPVAAAAKVKFADVGGALATMTAQNMSAQQATQDLRHTIMSLESPNKVAQKEMAGLGLSATDLSQNLGKRGLAATLQMVAEAARQHAGALGQTYTQAMYKAMGGTVGLTTSLMLTGRNMATFKGNVDTVAAAAAKGGGQVDNWGRIQGTFNFKLEQAKASVEAMGISLGSALLPAVTAVLGPLAHMMSVIAGNKAASIALAVVIGGLLAGALGGKLAKSLKDSAEGIKSMGDGIGWLIGKLTGSAAAAEADAAAQDAAAGESSSSWIASAAKTSGAMVASAARTVAAWAVTGAQMVAQAAAWVASNTAKVAVVVAENVAGAAATMAAWVAANAVMLLGIGLIVAVVVAVVVLIIKHWRQISAEVARIWDDVVSFVSRAVDAVVGFVRAHWPLLLAILTGPIGLAVLFITEHYHQILSVIDSAIAWVRSHWPLLLAILTGPIGLATLWIVDRWHQIVSGAEQMGEDVISFFRGLPGRILSAVGDLGSLLFGAGERVIQGLINGVTSMIGSVGHAIGSVVDTIKSYLPFSPARQGPLSGSGAPENSGRSIARNIARGLTAGMGDVTQAMEHITGAVAPRGGYGAFAAGGGYGGAVLVLRVEPTGNRVMDAIFDGMKAEVRNRAGGGPDSVQRALGRTW